MTLITPGQTELTGAVWMETFAKLDVFIFTSFHFIPTAVIICSYLMTNSRSNFQPQFMYNLPAIISTNLMLIVKARSFPISFGSSYRKKEKKSLLKYMEFNLRYIFTLSANAFCCTCLIAS